eukprot:996245-Rhodomonas_salina.1
MRQNPQCPGQEPEASQGHCKSIPDVRAHDAKTSLVLMLAQPHVSTHNHHDACARSHAVHMPDPTTFAPWTPSR